MASSEDLPFLVVFELLTGDSDQTIWIREQMKSDAVQITNESFSVICELI